MRLALTMEFQGQFTLSYQYIASLIIFSRMAEVKFEKLVELRNYQYMNTDPSKQAQFVDPKGF